MGISQSIKKKGFNKFYTSKINDKINTINIIDLFRCLRELVFFLGEDRVYFWDLINRALTCEFIRLGSKEITDLCLILVSEYIDHELNKNAYIILKSLLTYSSHNINKSTLKKLLEVHDKLLSNLHGDLKKVKFDVQRASYEDICEIISVGVSILRYDYHSKLDRRVNLYCYAYIVYSKLEKPLFGYYRYKISQFDFDRNVLIEFYSIFVPKSLAKIDVVCKKLETNSKTKIGDIIGKFGFTCTKNGKIYKKKCLQQ